jgi:hypothetical protein
MRELLSLSYIWEVAGGNEGSLIRRESDESFVGGVFFPFGPQISIDESSFPRRTARLSTIAK